MFNAAVTQISLSWRLINACPGHGLFLHTRLPLQVTENHVCNSAPLHTPAPEQKMTFSGAISALLSTCNKISSLSPFPFFPHTNLIIFRHFSSSERSCFFSLALGFCFKAVEERIYSKRSKKKIG